MKTEILLFGGYEDLDAIGPLSVLSAAGFDVSVVTADDTHIVTSAGGVPAVPAGRLGTPRLLIVPGGGWTSRDPAGAWAEARRGVIPQAIAACAKEGATIASVCTGAMLLAEAGLLTGRPATTHHGAHAELEAAGARLIPGARVVDDGDLLTSAGVTAGLDLALWLVERELGADAARAAERELEYRRGDVYRPASAPGRPASTPGRAASSAGTSAAGDAGAQRELDRMLPVTPLARTVLDHVRREEPPFLFNHSVRSYLFASLAAGWQQLAAGGDYDDEALFAACLMHDLGLTPAAGQQERFEVAGADLTTGFLRGHAMDERRAQLVWEAVALHTSAGIAERRAPEVALTRIGIGLDFGRGTEAIPDGLAATIHAAYPRLGMARALVDAIVAHGSGHPGAAPPYSLPGELARERCMAPFASRLELAASRGRWGS